MGHPTSSAAAVNPTDVQRKSDRELVVTRTFDAPRALVWKVMTERTCSGAGGSRRPRA